MAWLTRRRAHQETAVACPDRHQAAIALAFAIHMRQGFQRHRVRASRDVSSRFKWLDDAFAVMEAHISGSVSTNIIQVSCARGKLKRSYYKATLTHTTQSAIAMAFWRRGGRW
jgi:hypothetical protein